MNTNMNKYENGNMNRGQSKPHMKEEHTKQSLKGKEKNP